jgi:hypothetical protein
VSLALIEVKFISQLILHMSYLKIFPKSIFAKRNAVGGYEGYLLYDFEQYGRMLYGYDSGVALLCDGPPYARWLIESTDFTYKLSGFSVFLHAMNHYLFTVLQFDPVSQLKQVSDTEYEYYFDRVYFDMDTQKFDVLKKIPVTNPDETMRKLLRLKLRS